MLTIVYDRYARRYDTQRHTLRQQSIEPAGTYRIELQETLPYQHWSQPAHETTTERMPHWGWWVLAVLCLLLMAMLGYVWFLHRQRRIFLNEIKKPEPLSIGGQQESAPDTTGTAAAEAYTASTPLPQEDEPIAGVPGFACRPVACRCGPEGVGGRQAERQEGCGAEVETARIDVVFRHAYLAARIAYAQPAVAVEGERHVDFGLAGQMAHAVLQDEASLLALGARYSGDESVRNCCWAKASHCGASSEGSSWLSSISAEAMIMP